MTFVVWPKDQSAPSWATISFGDVLEKAKLSINGTKAVRNEKGWSFKLNRLKPVVLCLFIWKTYCHDLFFFFQKFRCLFCFAEEFNCVFMFCTGQFNHCTFTVSICFNEPDMQHDHFRRRVDAPTFLAPRAVRAPFLGTM